MDGDQEYIDTEIPGVIAEATSNNAEEKDRNHFKYSRTSRLFRRIAKFFAFQPREGRYVPEGTSTSSFYSQIDSQNLENKAVNEDYLCNSNSIDDSSNSSYLPDFLDEKIIDDLIERGKHEKNKAFSDLEYTLDKVFSNSENLSKSFRLKTHKNTLVPLKRPTNLSDTEVDFKNLRSSLKKVFELDNMLITNAINVSIMELSESIRPWLAIETELEAYMHCIVICFELTSYLVGNEYPALSELCCAVTKLSISYQARLARIWAEHCKDTLRKLVQSLQDRITEALIHELQGINKENDIISLKRVLKIAFYANILAGDVARPFTRFFEDPFEIELNISVIDCHKPLIPYAEFYNDAVSEVLQQIPDILLKCFSFWKYSFILSPVAKIMTLHQNIASIMSERKLQFKIRRDNIVDDVLNEIQKIESVGKFLEPLTVEFEGEVAIDQGGVSKEFFSVIIEKFFQNDFGLFSYQEETKTMWFKPYSPENDSKYKLVGIILGLSVINKINLAVNFPMVIFRKLLGGAGSFNDLEDWSPTLYRNLKNLLDYENEQTFTICKTNAFGKVEEHELLPGGADIKVGQHNKEEFFDLYSDYLLNESIDKQFEALQTGFEMVTHLLPIRQLFRPEEFELLLCGSKTFDFVELQRVTVYEGGYTKDSRVVQDFWSIVHAMTNEMQGKLLEFTTGSDRIPVGGFNRLKFIIQRNGPDCDRLPSSHTCFNILDLPEYSNKEKTEERLMKAFNYTRGFGLV